MKNLVRGAVVMVAICIASLGYAQGDVHNDNLSATGAVVSATTNAVVIRTDTGETMTFARDTSSNAPMNLAAGSRVTIQYDRRADGDLYATNISMATDAGSRTGTPGTTSTTGTTRQTDATTRGTTTSTLPQTASPVVLTGLLGLAASGGAVFLRARRKR
jgi:LPXTG-motif cell wall-anchored protein